MFTNKQLSKIIIVCIIIAMVGSIAGCSKPKATPNKSTDSVVENTPMPTTDVPTDEEESSKSSTDTKTDADTSTLHELIDAVKNSSYQPSEYLQGDAQSDTVRWTLATYAIYTNKNHNDWFLIAGAERDPRLLLDPNDPDADITDVQTYDFSDLARLGLVTGWKITSRESAMDTIKSLVDKGQRATYQTEMQSMIDFGIMEKDIIKEYGTNEDAYRMLATQQAYEKFGDRALIGWDLSRANQVLGDCYDAEYISLEECLSLSLEISKLIQHEYSSWDELASSYLLGYQFWKKVDPNDQWGELKDRRESYEELKEMPDGPYTLPFDMDLICTWDEEQMAKNKHDFLDKELARQEEKARFEDKPTVTDPGGYITVYHYSDPDISAKLKIPEGYVEEEFSDDRNVYTYNEANKTTIDYSMKYWEEPQSLQDYADYCWFSITRDGQEPKYCNFFEEEKDGIHKYVFVSDYKVAETIEGTHHTAGDKTTYKVLVFKERADKTWGGLEAYLTTPFDPNLKGAEWEAKEAEMIEMISANIEIQ